MTFNPKIHHRKSIRLQGYDYSQAGLYFITLCTHNRRPLFGKIIDGKMQLNDAGTIVHEEWHKTAHIRPNIVLHNFVIMPNHLHGIIECTPPNPITPNDVPLDVQQGRVARAPTAGDIVRGFKSSVTRRLNAAAGTSGQRF